MINYSVVRHENGKIRIIEDANGDKRFLTKGKKRYFYDAEAADILHDKQRSNERKAKIWLNNKRAYMKI